MSVRLEELRVGDKLVWAKSYNEGVVYTVTGFDYPFRLVRVRFLLRTTFIPYAELRNYETVDAGCL